jgi:hypothetical protein
VLLALRLAIGFGLAARRLIDLPARTELTNEGRKAERVFSADGSSTGK